MLVYHFANEVESHDSDLSVFDIRKGSTVGGSCYKTPTVSYVIYGKGWKETKLTSSHSSHKLNEMEKKFALKEFGTQLWTREKARPIRSRLVDALELLRTGDILAIDASGVDVFDFSFAAELFGKALSRLGVDYPGRFVIAEGLSESARENLNQALEASNLIIIERHGSELRLLGKVHPTDQDTFTGILGAGEAVSAAALGKKLDVTMTAMNERLSKLHSLGIVRREKSSSASGREQYVYKVMG